MAEDEYQKVMAILQENRDKSFVQRILDPTNSPKLDLGNGNFATHKMAVMEANGKSYVFPTVLRMEDGSLKQFDPISAFDQTRRTGNQIEFDSPQEAEWFSRRYKSVWGQ